MEHTGKLLEEADRNTCTLVGAVGRGTAEEKLELHMLAEGPDSKLRALGEQSTALEPGR